MTPQIVLNSGWMISTRTRNQRRAQRTHDKEIENDHTLPACDNGHQPTLLSAILLTHEFCEDYVVHDVTVSAPGSSDIIRDIIVPVKMS